MVAGAVQICSGEDFRLNLEKVERLTLEAAEAGAELVVLPEKWPCLGRDQALRASAQPLDGPLLEALRRLAQRGRLALVGGSFVERRRDGTLANTTVLLDREGELLATYSKIHLFDVEVDGHSYQESALISPGDRPAVAPLGPFTVGLSICYDLRFPELYRALALAGATLLPLPSAFTYATTRDHWEVLVRARAIENQCFVVAANQIGHHPGGLRSGGRSLIVDPWGVVLAQAPDRECFILAPLELAALERVRATLPTLQNRRPAAYAAPPARRASR